MAVIVEELIEGAHRLELSTAAAFGTSTPTAAGHILTARALAAFILVQDTRTGARVLRLPIQGNLILGPCRLRACDSVTFRFHVPILVARILEATILAMVILKLPDLKAFIDGAGFRPRFRSAAPVSMVPIQEPGLSVTPVSDMVVLPELIVGALDFAVPNSGMMAETILTIGIIDRDISEKFVKCLKC